MQSFRQIWHHTNKGQLYWMDMERVIGTALAGDQQAIAKLYNAYFHKVLGICYNIVGNRAVAEELSHDAFVLRLNGFSPTIAGNSVYTQGFFQEVSTFVNAIEGVKANVLTDLQSIEPTLKLIDGIS